jgi:hypothetical protein
MTMIHNWRLVQRSLALVLALATIGLWFLFSAEIFALSDGMPAPGGIMLPLFYGSVALGAAFGSVRDEPVVLVLAGGLSLFPGGLLLLMIPGPSRLIALIDIALIILGVWMMRSPREPATPPDAGSSAPA